MIYSLLFWFSFVNVFTIIQLFYYSVKYNMKVLEVLKIIWITPVDLISLGWFWLVMYNIVKS